MVGLLSFRFQLQGVHRHAAMVPMRDSFWTGGIAMVVVFVGVWCTTGRHIPRRGSGYPSGCLWRNFRLQVDTDTRQGLSVV